MNGCLQTIRQTSEGAAPRPHLLGVAVSALAELAIGPGHRAIRNGHQVAPKGFQVVLAMEI